MRVINRTILLFLIIFSATLNAQVQNTAKVTYVLGAVKVVSSGQTKWRKVSYNMIVKKGDRLQTTLNAQVEITMPDGSRIKVNENSIFEIKEIKVSKTEQKDEMSFSLFAGNIWAKFKKLINSRQSRKIESPSAVVAIRGTEFEMEVNKQGATGLNVIEGKVAFKSRDTGDEVLVGAGQSSIVEKGKPPTRPATSKKTQGAASGTGTTGQGQFEVNVKKIQTDPAVLGTGIVVTGKLAPGATLIADGQPINVDTQGNFSGNVRVKEGLNTIKLTASLNGRTKSQTVKVFVNTKKPEIQFSTPIVSGFYNRRDYSLSGAVFDPTPLDKITVYLNKEMVIQVQGRGSFNRTIILKEGENIIHIRAVDLANNTTEVSQKLFLDTVKPIITMTEPAQPVYTRFEPPPPPGQETDLSRQRFTQIIRGLIIDPKPSSGIKSVTINGQEVKPNVDGSFEMKITLRRGENRLNIVAEDIAGNIRRSNNRIIRVQ
jgi:hypothetical protein